MYTHSLLAASPIVYFPLSLQRALGFHDCTKFQYPVFYSEEFLSDLGKEITYGWFSCSLEVHLIHLSEIIMA